VTVVVCAVLSDLRMHNVSILTVPIAIARRFIPFTNLWSMAM
jgi:hypothetical protein